jgi:cell division protein FtsB
MLDKLNKFGMLSAFIIGAWAVGFLMGGRSLERYDPARQALEFEVADQSEQIEKLRISNFMLEANLNQLQGATSIDADAPAAAAPAER